MAQTKKLVMVAGKYDPLHEGHIQNIIAASKLGSLIIITHSDEVIAKQSKGFCAIPLEYRILILEGLLLRLKIKGIVRQSTDLDGTITETLRTWKPDILAKGGDRIPSNMPQSELDVCKEINCEIVYGLGKKINSSSRVMGL